MAPVLNEHVRPLSCQVHWSVHAKDKTFSGSNTWVVSVDSAADSVKLHADELRLDGVRVRQYKKPVKVAKIDRSPGGLLCIQFEAPLQEGRAELTFSFSGSIAGTVGVHYAGDTNFIQTHFEVTHARKAFPCFDLPSIRASYQVTVTSLDNPDACILSCMPVASQRVKGAGKQVDFVETPPIPAYVLAFMVAPADITPVTDELSTDLSASCPVSVYPPAGISKYPVDLLLKASVYGLREMEQFLRTAYPLPKFDVAVVPKLCLAGMENHGLAFLDGVDTAPGKGKKGGSDSLIELLMHEIAHMWLGNLVGLDFWVKEGLAQYFERVLADGFLSRGCTLPTDTKFNAGSAPVDIGAKPKKPAAKPAGKQTKQGKKDAKKGAQRGKEPDAAPGAATDAVDNHDVFNGNMYTKSYLWVVGVERALGRSEFLSRLSKLVGENADGFVTEKLFLDTFVGGSVKSIFEEDP
ncbi:Aminopeptidase M1-D [Diplonema papillatum]|nr:Aminopeptidase M1-D [Diplonema papillatum]|eukprot:gene18177-28012_t